MVMTRQPRTAGTSRTSVQGLAGRLRGRWQRVPDRHLVLAALGAWLCSRIAYAIAIQAGLFDNHPVTIGRQTPFASAMYRWDAGWYLRIAQHWYFWPGFEHDPLGYGQGHIAFLPMPPLLIKVVELFTGSFALAGLLVSAAASAVALVALARLVRFELDDLPGPLADAGARAAPVLLAFAPYAVFLFLPYSEPVFLAFAIPAWLAARRSRWAVSGILLAGATATKIYGLFVLAGIVVLYVQQRRRDQLPVLRPAALWLLAPLSTIGAYFLYLHARTGDWLAWQHAQERSWGRTQHGLWDSWSRTWAQAFDAPRRSDYVWARRAELAFAVLGLVLIVVLLLYRRWAESLYIALSWYALASGGVYLSFPRSALLWFPAFVLLARAVARRPWLRSGYLAVCTPLAFVLGAAWAASGWVN